MINHKGSTGQIEIEEANIFFSQMLNIFDILTFKGEMIAESTKDFQDSGDNYLKFRPKSEIYFGS